MSTRMLFAAVVACLALLGCENMPEHHPGVNLGKFQSPKPLECSKACELAVAVDCAPNCKAYLEHQVVLVKGGSATIVWRLNTSRGFKFANDDGIAFDNRDFRCGAGEDPGTFKCEDAHKEFGVHTYRVHVVDSEQGTTVELADPWIVNY